MTAQPAQYKRGMGLPENGAFINGSNAIDGARLMYIPQTLVDFVLRCNLPFLSLKFVVGSNKKKIIYLKILFAIKIDCTET